MWNHNSLSSIKSLQNYRTVYPSRLPNKRIKFHYDRKVCGIDSTNSRAFEVLGALWFRESKDNGEDILDYSSDFEELFEGTSRGDLFVAKEVFWSIFGMYEIEFSGKLS